MQINLGEKLKTLRKEKNVSQEKLAQFLNVSFQAVSKWECNSAYPDISLLPDIARYFDITVDELLQAEKIDEEKLYAEYEQKAAKLYYAGKMDENIELWKEAYRKMPNKVQVKEMLMSGYFDTDKIKYANEIIELGTEICSMDVRNYYKGQAISQIARTYAASGNQEMAEKWAGKSMTIHHSEEFINMEILKNEQLLFNVSYSINWMLNGMFWMACRIDDCDVVDTAHKLGTFRKVAGVYETVYAEDEMSFFSREKLCITYRMIAELEAELGGDENTVREYLEKAAGCAEKAMYIEDKRIHHPLLYDWPLGEYIGDKKNCARMVLDDLNEPELEAYREREWFTALKDSLEKLIEE